MDLKNCWSTAGFRMQREYTTFYIMDNPDFEYVACLHSPQYRGQDPHKFIESVLGAKSIAAFKGNADVYNFLNSGELSYQIMMESLRGKESCCTINMR